MDFKKGDTVICVDNVVDGDLKYDLTCGRFYTIEGKVLLYHIYIVDDLNNLRLYDTHRFISLCEYRDNVVSNILD